MAEAQGGLCVTDGIGRLDDVAQQVTLREWHDATSQRSGTIVDVPSDVTHAPLFVDLVVGIDREEVDVGVVALHIGDHLEEVIHERQGLDVFLHPLGIAEQLANKAVGVEALGWCTA